MDRTRQRMVHANESSSLADLLERILDKGIVIAGDIKIKLVEVELLTIQVRLMIASVDKAREMGMDWWMRNPDFTSQVAAPPIPAAPIPAALSPAEEIAQLKQRLRQLEAGVVDTEYARESGAQALEVE